MYNKKCADQTLPSRHTKQLDTKPVIYISLKSMVNTTFCPQYQFWYKLKSQQQLNRPNGALLSNKLGHVIGPISGNSVHGQAMNSAVAVTLGNAKLQIQPQRIQIGRQVPTTGNNRPGTSNGTQRDINRTQIEALTDVIPSSVQNIVSLYHNFDARSNIS